MIMKNKNRSSSADLMLRILRHDLINPVAAIRMTSDALLLGNLDKKTKTNLEAIKDLCDQEIELIRDASTYAGLYINKISKVNLDLNILFKKILMDLNSKIEKKHLEIKYSSDKSFKIVADPKIELVFINLLSNAIKYSPEGEKIETGFLDKKNKIQFYVKDKGRGIENKDKLRIFNRFAKEDKEGIMGIGLGMVIVKKIIEMHHGRVWVENNPGGGSIFYFEIPK